MQLTSKSSNTPTTTGIPAHRVNRRRPEVQWSQVEEKNMAKKNVAREIENIRSESGAEGLAKMSQLLGYKSRFGQLMFNNGATASDLFEFFEDNPGAVEAVINWALENHPNAQDDVEDEECNEDEEEEDEDSDEG